MICKQEDFSKRWFVKKAKSLSSIQYWRYWFDAHGKPFDIRFHRKTWEFVVIAQGLEERHLLKRGKRALGFAVGHEPLPSYFANKGVEVLATDLPADHPTAAAWSFGGQHTVNLSSLHYPAILGRKKFDEKVKFKPVDMTNLSGIEKGSFDFIWSSCSLEHLGSLEAGVQFILDSLSLLKEGGLAVHTTEFNCSSNERTIETGGCVIYRRRDLEELACRVRCVGCWMDTWDFNPGCSESDLNFDYPPYYTHGRDHTKLLVNDYVVTSALMIIHRSTG